MFVQIQPCNSRALYLLGNAQFEQYDNDPEADQASQLLDDAKLSFKAAIGLEGKPAAGAPTEQLTGLHPDILPWNVLSLSLSLSLSQQTEI